ncbi:MoxR family ATPase [Sporosarcina thermotolerans]|uniref:MoxR family ATPase n=1 Tax=Sporosarcina thermotolerans TaxID=633404 RepID=A0AAW9A4E9_9BACL|nr:MoxR family ATPase [Sporosarcina thermotolerans]MDW0115907.1 MoxR family ATPase [Sporosarcina thermotolerans]WHT46872.1 MoxR family ATPase [Sporosarcina thermotolerans]
MVTIKDFRKELNQAVIGREKEFDLMLIALLQDGHVLLESVPGSGKTMMAKSFANAFKGDFKRVQFTPDVLPSDVTGIRYFNPQSQDFILKAGPVSSNILLADEINRATPRTQSSLLESMEEKQVTIDGETLPLPKPFMVIATQNPIESQQGTFPLPAAQLDRFLFKLNIDYPTFEEEHEILKQYGQKPGDIKTQTIIDAETVLKWAAEARKVSVHEDIEKYILKIVRATREHPFLELGLSSRAALAILQATRTKAYLEGRDYATPDDVKAIVAPVALHRMELSTEGVLTKSIDEVLQEIVVSIPTPLEATV